MQKQTKEMKSATDKNPVGQVVTIKPPNFQSAQFTIIGTAPLVVHRFSAKLKEEFRLKQEAGDAPKGQGKKPRKAKDTEVTFNEARYQSAAGWDGFHAAALRNACISACRLVNFKMTLAKLSIFVMADGYDKYEPQIPLVRIIGKPVKQEDIARVETGQPYLCVRAAYHDWKANIRIRWDADQFTVTDIANLLSRVGLQVGLCEGRPDSKNSAGMGWGTFDVQQA